MLREQIVPHVSGSPANQDRSTIKVNATPLAVAPVGGNTGQQRNIFEKDGEPSSLRTRRLWKAVHVLQLYSLDLPIGHGITRLDWCDCCQRGTEGCYSDMPEILLGVHHPGAKRGW